MHALDAQLAPSAPYINRSMRVCTILLGLSTISSFALGLWPRPREITTGSTPLRLAPGFSVSLSGISGAPSDLVDAVRRTQGYLKNDKLQALIPDRGASSKGAVSKAKALRTLQLKYTGQGKPKSISEEAIAAIDTRDEAYTLTVPADGTEAVLTASSSLGLFRGLTTFSQIWYDLDGTTYTLQAPISIRDSPAYKYRGFMLDTARNYFPVADIKRHLDAMSWTKINTLHWHIVDSQSFPLVIPGFQVISERGAYNKQAVYSPADVKEITDYGAARGIDVFAEIDTPGHTSILYNSFPEHIACFEASPWTQFANEPPAGQLRLASPATVNFTASLLTAAANLFPSKFFSTGGDEINNNCYNQDAQTQADLAGRTIDQALNTFTEVSHNALKAAGKTPVVWQEMLLVHNVTLSQDTAVLVWISSQDAAAVAQRGHRLIHAASDYFYLDCGGGGWVGSNINGNSWCDPFKTWQKAYSFNPTANIAEDRENLVLGGQQLLWTEQAGPSNLDSIAWPRAAASAEVFWSGAGGDVRTALPRLHDLAYRYVQRGVKAIALQPEWCALRPGKCDLDA